MATHRNRAERWSSSISESASSKAALFSASVTPSPAKRAERTPGRPPSASTSSPESSARVTIIESEAAERPLMRALSSSVAPSSAGGGRSGSAVAREMNSTGRSLSSERSSAILPRFVVASRSPKGGVTRPPWRR